MGTTKKLTVERMTETVGARVLDVDLERIREDADLPEEVMGSLEEHGVLVFKDLGLDDETQVSFCRRLGEIVTFPGMEIPEIWVITLDPTQNPLADMLKATVGWHIDGTVDPIPAKATMLSAKALSDVGGETEFASTCTAYDELSTAEKERFADVRVFHSQEAAQRDGHPNPTEEQLAAWRKKSREHPLVWTHQSGRKSLVIGHSADHVVGMDIEEGRALMQDLLDRATTPDRVYRHHWSPSDTIMWDNRSVVHRVTPYDPASPRRLHRTTLVGDEPIQ